MEKRQFIITPFIEEADKAADIYTFFAKHDAYKNLNLEGLKNYISLFLAKSPLSSEEIKEITNIIAEEYKNELENSAF